MRRKSGDIGIIQKQDAGYSVRLDTGYLAGFSAPNSNVSLKINSDGYPASQIPYPT
jgi:hypothetical protein